MAVFAIITFGVSLILIASLFVLKYWEMGTGKLLAPVLRIRADEQALRLKSRLFHLRHDLSQVPPFALLYCRYLIHEAALGFAAFARLCERGAHRLADLVSHKHSFVPRETRSEFLRQVSGRRSNGDTEATRV